MTRLDKKLAERDQLNRNYRRTKQAELEVLRADPEYGERMRIFIATLSHFRIEHGDRMLEFVFAESRKWLSDAPINVRHVAFAAIDERCMLLRERAGMKPFDDPLPGEDDNVFLAAKRMLKL